MTKAGQHQPPTATSFSASPQATVSCTRNTSSSKDDTCRSRHSSTSLCTYIHTRHSCPADRQLTACITSYLCWISRPSFLFLVWSAGEGEFKFLAGGATSAMVSLEPSWSEAPLSVFLHLALRFWNHTWSRRAILGENRVQPNVKQEGCKLLVQWNLSFRSLAKSYSYFISPLLF